MKTALRNAILALLSAAMILVVSFGAPSRHADAQAQPCATIWVGFVEVTQAIQKPSPSITLVPLVDGRRTGVRVFVNGLPYGCQGPSINVRLLGTSGITSLGRPAFSGWSDGGPMNVKSSWSRSVETDSFNFEFTPEGWTGYTYAFATEIWTIVNGLPAQLLRTDQAPSRYFHKACPPDIAGVRVSMPDTNPPNNNAPEESGVIPGKADRMMWAVYPFPEYNKSFSHEGGYRLLPDILKVNGAAPTGREVFSALEKKAREDPQPDYIVGWLKRRPSGIDSEGQAGIRSMTSWAYVNDGSLTHAAIEAMEIGHNFGYEHDSYGLTIDEIGWDVKNALALGRVKTTNTVEYMFSGSTINWTGPEAYVDTYYNPRANGCQRPLRNIIIAPIISPITPVPWPPPFPQSGWTIGTAVSMSSVGRPITQETIGHAKLELLDETGTVLFSTRFDPVVMCEGSEPCTYTVADRSVNLPWYSNAESIKLYIDDVLQDTRVKSANAPSISITSPPPGTMLSSSTIVEWTATDADGDALQSDVHYSHDGVRWKLLDAGLTGSSLALAADTLPSSNDALVRVTVSDGFNTTEQIVGGLVLSQNQSPQVYIMSPGDGFAVKSGANVVLLASAVDPETSVMQNGQMSWASSLDGLLGYGDLLNVTSLSVGTHTITFSALDSAGAMATDTVTIDVLAW